MRFHRLYIRGLRCFSELELHLHPGLNVFVGANGTGKTSLLEAAFLFSHARSFRVGAKEALVQRGSEQLQLFAELDSQQQRHRLGLGREQGRWQVRLNGEPASVGALVRLCAVTCFAPSAQALLSGASDERRRFLDWGLFHVEPDFLQAWRRYQRALKQRNALLKSQGLPDPRLYRPWEEELADSGIAIDHWRQTYLKALQPELAAMASILLPKLGTLDLKYQRGWPIQSELLDELQHGRERDRQRGHTQYGPHRADWSVSFAQGSGREYLSRGQEKLSTLSLCLAQCRLFQQQRGEWPIFCIDDLAAELDQAHQQILWQQLQQQPAQILITGTMRPSFVDMSEAALFHVEQEMVRNLL